jgi:light-regulated signal transduction histidine kinase (bacteriophytochrome)
MDLGSVMTEAIANLHVAIEESQARIECDTLLPTVMSDRGQMVQLFQNLIGNAIKYRHSRSPEVHVQAVTNGASSWMFRITDNGIGFDPKQADRIFMIFQRLHTRQEYSGTGIGLAVCKKIVERHGGKIWADSKPGEGSTFSFTMPKAVAANAPSSDNLQTAIV